MTDTPAEPRGTLTVHELDELRRDGSLHVLLDVREPSEVEICRIDGSRHVPMGQLGDRLHELPRDRPVVVMCHHGIRSAMVVEQLRRLGIDSAVNLEGGIDAWAREIDPDMAVY